MKRALQFIVALSVVAMFMVNPVAAATSQGLEWGIQSGDRFDFTLTSEEYGWNDGLYMNVSSVPGIPDPLNNWNSIPQPTGSTFWTANDTTVGIVALIFLGLFFVGSKVAVPVGNFSLLWDYASAILTGEQQIDETNVWGIRWTQELNATHESAVEATYSKVDGWLAEYRLETLLSSSQTVLYSITVIRNNIPSPGLDLGNIMQLLQDNLLIVGAGIVILILIIVVIKRR